MGLIHINNIIIYNNNNNKKNKNNNNNNNNNNKKKKKKKNMYLSTVWEDGMGNIWLKVRAYRPSAVRSVLPH